MKKSQKQTSNPDRSPAAGKASAEPTPLPAGVSMAVAYEAIRPDPDQPRKTFKESALDEMAESIHHQGIIQPLILEEMPAKYKVHEPDLTHTEWFVVDLVTGEEVFTSAEENMCVLWCGGGLDLKPFYKILAGERRWRGAGRKEYTNGAGELVKWRGLATVPAIVHTGLNDKQRFAIQSIENLQRENLTALEEAVSLKKELEKRKALDPAFSPEALAKEIGMSRAGIYERMKLTRLHPPIHAALVEGKISTSVAGEIAKLPTPASQEKLLAEIIEAMEYDLVSVRDVQEMIENYVKQLSDAPFDTTATFTGYELPKEAHHGPCTDCPYRSGNMVSAFRDLKTRPNICTNTDCFAAKTKAHWMRTAEAEKAKGKTVITEKEFKALKKVSGAGYVKGTEYEYAENKSGSFETLMGKHKPEPVLVATEEGVEKFYPKEDAMAAARKNGVKFRRQETAESREKAQQKLKASEEAKARRRNLAEGLQADLMKGANKLKAAEVVDLMLPFLRSRLGLHGTAKRLFKAAVTPQARVMAYVVGSGGGAVDWHGDWKEDALPAWKACGVDLLAAEKAEQKKPALPLPEAEAKQKDLPGASTGKMSAAGRARIAAAAKARWAKAKAAKKGGAK